TLSLLRPVFGQQLLRKRTIASGGSHASVGKSLKSAFQNCRHDSNAEHAEPAELIISANSAVPSLIIVNFERALRIQECEDLEMTLDDLRTLLDFHYWARDRVLEAAGRLTLEQFTREMGSSYKSVRDTLAHLYSVEWAWYQRWHGTSPTAMLPFDQFPDVASLKTVWTAHEAKMRSFLE